MVEVTFVNIHWSIYRGSLQGEILERTQVDSFSYYVPGTENRMIVPDTYLGKFEPQMIASRCQQENRKLALIACSGTAGLVTQKVRQLCGELPPYPGNHE